MRHDMAKVVTERPRRGHANASRKWGWRLGTRDFDADDHGATRAPIARRHQYGWKAKEFSDLLGPLRRYLRRQVGRPWNAVWSEISRTLDSRSVSGQHIFDHIRWEVTLHAAVGEDGVVYEKRRKERALVRGLYVHPATGLLCSVPHRRPLNWYGAFLRARAALHAFGIDAATPADIRRYRIDGLRVWEQRAAGWFVHTYRHVPAELDRVIVRSDGREVPVYRAPRYERVATRQASRKEVRRARVVLEREPVAARE